MVLLLILRFLDLRHLLRLIYPNVGLRLVGMIVRLEAVLARDEEMCYFTACFVINMTAGIQQRRLTVQEVVAVAKERVLVIQKI